MLRNVAHILWLSLAGLPALAQTRIISHVTSPIGGFTTEVVLENLAAQTEEILLLPYDIAGNPLDGVSLLLSAASVFSSTNSELFQGEVSHFEIEASADVKVGVNYNFQEANGSPAFVAEEAEQASSWRFFPGNWSIIFDGIAVVNMGDVATDVWIAQKDGANNFVQAHRIVAGLAPKAKALFVVGSPNGSDFSEMANTHFEVSADQLLAITALRGTLPDAETGLLWANEARPLSLAHSKRDDRGVWFIEDGSLYDVAEMMAYNMAVDRLAQMEIFRRLGRGEMAELDAGFLEFDIISRQLMYSDAELDAIFESLDSENKTLFRAYVAGTNRRIAQVNATAGSEESLLPVEYQVFGMNRAVPWTVRDAMAHLARTQRGFSMRTVGSEQILNGSLLLDLQARFGAEQGALMFEDLRYIYDPETQTMIHKREDGKRAFRPPVDGPLPVAKPEALGWRNWLHEAAARMRRIEQLQIDKGILVKMGSYAWAVSGDKTASGNPILYSAPQVGFTAPSLMVEGSVESEALTASGMLLPGIPAFVVARTPHHAWSMQVGHANTWDYYVVDEDQAVVDRTEIVKARGLPDTSVEVEVSPHGPIIDSLGDKRLAFKYAHRNVEFDLAGGILNMAGAQSIEEFGQAVETIGVSQHITYVDVDGNIAYWHSGRDPVRPEGDYRVPQGILEGQPILEWDRDVYHPLAHEANPPEGWYAGWNNKARDEDVDLSATSSHGPFHRGHVIKEYFDQFDPENPWTYEDLNNLAIDIGATGNFAAGGNPWTFLGPAVRDAVAANPSPERDAAIALFDGWDGHRIAGGPDQWIGGNDVHDASILLEAIIPKLLTKTFQDEYGPPLRDYDVFFRFHTLLHGLYPGEGLDNRYDWFSNLADAGAPQTADAIILASLDEALAELGPQPWGIGARGTIVYAHFVFGNISLLVDLPPTPASQRGTYSQSVEYGPEGPIQIRSILALGQSGTILGALFDPVIDPNNFTMKEDFDAFHLREFPLFGDP